MKITISKENYLKTIAEAESEGEPVIAATLARWLNVSAPAVTMAIKRLKRDVDSRRPRMANLAHSSRPRNRQPAAERHHLIERMLTEMFGMEWYKVHDEAEQLEHAVSADFERRLAIRRLRFPFDVLVTCWDLSLPRCGADRRSLAFFPVVKLCGNGGVEASGLLAALQSHALDQASRSSTAPRAIVTAAWVGSITGRPSAALRRLL